MPNDTLTLRKQIVECCQKMNAMGINQGTSGNISARCEGGILITPSATPYDTMQPEDVVFIDSDGKREQREDNKVPSTEWRFHMSLLQTRPEFGAVIHTHSTHATAMSICRQDIPAAHYMIAAAGTSLIRCADYATYGTAELEQSALAAIAGANACLLANHGVIAGAADLAKALWLATEVEVLARQYILALSIGKPYILSDEEVQRVIAKFTEYGLKAD